jgi:hypothetical protein
MGMRSFFLLGVLVGCAVTPTSVPPDALADDASVPFIEGPDSRALRIRPFDRLPPLDPKGVEGDHASDDGAWRRLRPLTSDVEGIVVEVEPGSGEMRWAGGGHEIIESPFAAEGDRTKWLETRSVSPGQVVTVRLRLAASTYAALITDTSYPLQLRFYAVRDLHLIDMPRAEQLRLLTIASADKEAEIRSMVLKSLDWYDDFEDFFPILMRGLQDPSVHVAEWTVYPLAKIFDLRDRKTGNAWPGPIDRSGPCVCVLERIWLRQFAEHLRALHPDLVREDDLPPDAQLPRIESPFGGEDW